jgi:eukaryotic-like serine/threonine-protein kinase
MGAEEGGIVSEPNVENLASRAAEAGSPAGIAKQTGEETLFAEALALAPELRRDFVERRCRGGNRRQAERVMELLESYEKSSTFLDRPAVLQGSPLDRGDIAPQPSEPKPGDHLGRYRLLERIGEGGFGVVYLAEQQEPVRRRVALKIIRLGLDTLEFIARFEAERQALALMDHPNIARVFDAGATPAGRPYLVMELIRGRPITAYCDEQRLSLRARLELFGRVCGAVQHAHQKGVIHRDLKPSISWFRRKTASRCRR